MVRPLTLIAVSIALSGSHALAGQSQPLSTALKTFDQEHDRAKKERELLEITQQYPESGPALLRLAEATQDVDTRWTAMRGMRDVHFRGCETFLIRELKSKDPLVRANAARVIGDLRFQSANGDLLAMFATEQDPGAVEQASLSLRMLGVKQGAAPVRYKIPLFTGQTRAWLLQALGDLGDKTDVPFVAGYLDDPDWGPQMMAAEALEELAGLNFGTLQPGPQPLPSPATLKARAWWDQHRDSWPSCDDCHFQVQRER